MCVVQNGFRGAKEATAEFVCFKTAMDFGIKWSHRCTHGTAEAWEATCRTTASWGQTAEAGLDESTDGQDSRTPYQRCRPH